MNKCHAVSPNIQIPDFIRGLFIVVCKLNTKDFIIIWYLILNSVIFDSYIVPVSTERVFQF